MVLHISSVRTMDLVQTKPGTALYQTLSHEVFVVQRVKGLASETTIFTGPLHHMFVYIYIYIYIPFLRQPKLWSQKCTIILISTTSKDHNENI